MGPLRYPAAMGAFTDPERLEQALSYGGVGISIAAALILLSRLLLERGTRQATRGPFLFLCGHLAVVALTVALDSGRVRDLLAVAATLLLLVSIGRSLTVLALDAILGQRLQRPAPKIFRDIIEGLLYVAAGLLTLRSAGVDPGSLLTTSALLTAIIGLSLQDTLGNLFAGLALQTEHPFGLGDWICYDQNPDHVGQVVEINWRATKVRTLDRVELTIPNGQLARSSILNYSQPTPLIRRSIHVTLPRETRPMEVHRVILEALVDCPNVLDRPETTVVTSDFGEYGMQYWVRYFIEQVGQREFIDGQVRDRIWYALHRAHIEIAVPIRDVAVRPPTEVRDADTAERALPLLREIEFLQDLGADDLQLLAQGARHMLYATGENVVRQGEPGDGLYVCESGEVAVLHESRGGTHELTRMAEGGLFGELSAVTGEPRAATVRTTMASELLKLDKDAFQTMLARNPSLADAMSRRLVARQGQLDSISPEVRKVTMGGGGGRADQGALLGRIRDFFRL